MKTKLRAQEGHNLELRDQTIGVRQGNIRRSFLTVNRDIANFNLQVEGDDVETADFSASASDALDFSDHPAAHIILEGLRGRVPQTRQDSDQDHAGGDEKNFPPAPRSGGRLVHRVWTPSPGEPSMPGTLTLLSDRSDCSHETISSFTRSWVSNSRILAETSARGTSSAPDCFKWGTNVSR